MDILFQIHYEWNKELFCLYYQTPVSYTHLDVYKRQIQRYASQYGISEYVPSIQAIMMQESGGRGTDPMQASECPYNTRYPNSPGAIQDPEYSICLLYTSRCV